MNKEELKKLQSELNSITEKKFSKLSDFQLERNEKLIAINKVKSKDWIEKISNSTKGRKVKSSTIEKLKKLNTLYGTKPAWNKGISGTKGKPHCEETKQKIRQKSIGKIISNKQKKIVSDKLSIAIIAINIKTGKIKEYKSTKEAKEKLGLSGILHVLKGRTKQCGGYYFEYKK